MGQILIEVSDDIFAAIQKQADAAGTSPARLVSKILEQQYCSKPESEADLHDARQRFENHFGKVNLGYPTGIDNEKIDEDLASAYADTHDPH